RFKRPFQNTLITSYPASERQAQTVSLAAKHLHGGLRGPCRNAEAQKFGCVRMERTLLLAADHLVGLCRQTRDRDLDFSTASRFRLQREGDSLPFGGPMDRLFFGKPCAGQFEVYLLAFRPQMQATAHSIAGNDLQSSVFGAHLATEAEAAEDRVVGNDGGGGPQRTAVTQVGFRRVVPRAAVVRLSKPCHAVRRRLEASTCSTIVCLAGEPVAEASFLRACIHE